MSTFEVHIRRKGAWSIDSFHDDVDEALRELGCLQGNGIDVRVTEELYDDASGRFKSKTIKHWYAKTKAGVPPKDLSEEQLVDRRARRRPGPRTKPHGAFWKPLEPYLSPVYYVIATDILVIGGIFAILGLHLLAEKI